MHLITKYLLVFEINFIIFSSTVFGFTPDTLIVKYYETEDLIYEITFLNELKVNSIQSFKSMQDTLIPDGYKYEFYGNGKVKNIKLFREGHESPFLLEFDKKGRYYSFISPGLGYDVIKILKRNSYPNRTLNPGVSPLNDNYITTNDAYNTFRIQYNWKNADIVEIYEYYFIINDSFTRNGIDINFNKKKISFIKYYTAGKVARESLYFNRTGKLQMVLFMDNINSLSKGVKSKHLYQYVNKD